MPSGYDPTGVQRFSEKIMLDQKTSSGRSGSTLQVRGELPLEFFE